MRKKRLWKKAALVLLSAAMLMGTPVMAMADEDGGADITWVDPDNFVDPPTDLWWNGTTAEWDEVGGYGYDVRLYHDGSAVDTVTVTGTSHGFSSKMKKSGSYYFKVRTIDYNGAYSEWSEKSGNKHVSGSNNNNHVDPTPSPTPSQPAGWVLEPSGRWWWRNANGTYPVNTWQMINNVWYYFEQSGYMHTGWLDYNGARYYCQPNGAMVVGWNNINEKWYYFEPTIGANYGKLWINAKTPDGHTLGADGARTDF